MRVVVLIIWILCISQWICFGNEKGTPSSLQAESCSEGGPGTWQPRGIGGGGAMFSPSFSPFDEDEIFLSSDIGELFHSKNAEGL